MKNYNNKKSILERGGLMIEALAMLGLIAVVTPTMYKKSAERTMEVEDINTATSMRTVMNAAEAFMSSNYADIMKVMEEDTTHQHTVGEGDKQQTIGVMDIPPEDLAPYLPYKFSEDSALFNYGVPKIRIVRAGDNLTAFAMFPAKVGGEDGIGQERTVRIASLIGANGGYVSEEKARARGVGGVWNLDGDYYNAVFDGSDDEKQFSLVTSSSNVVNGSNAMAEADPTEFLKRTKQDGSGWRNAMRTDLYMGSGPDNAQDPDDREHQNDFFSIYNVNELIIGADDQSNKHKAQLLRKAIKTGDADTDFESSKKISGDYGLYIAGSGSRGEGAGNAYIKGTLLAAGNRFWADSNTLKYTGTNLEFDGTNFFIGKNQSNDGQNAAHHVISGKAEKDNSQLAIMGTLKDSSGNMTGIVDIAEKGDIGNYKPKSSVQKKANVVINTTNKGTGGADVEAPKYSADDKAPEFGVDVSGNMVVEGVLAAGQLDVNKIRTSSISVGSENIDDEYKWMDVDKDGVHVHQPASGAYKGTQIEARDKLITMRVGGNNAIEKNTDSNAIEKDTEVQIVMDADKGITERVTKGKKVAVASGNLGVNIEEKDSNRNINIGTADDSGIVNGTGNSSDADYQVSFSKNADINVNAGNLKISDGSNPVFTVRGKGADGGSITDDLTGNDGDDYNIAGHGNTVFTDKGANSNKYLSMRRSLPENTNEHAAVNIIRGKQDSGTSDQGRGLVYVDMDDRASDAYAEVQVNTSSSYGDKGVNAKSTRSDANILAGGIYIRKGLIDIVPDSGASNSGFGDTASSNNYLIGSYNADDGMGVIRASRFVANNVTTSGKRVMVPEFFNSALYQEYNGADGNTRYDTYMVNPAYTSVMNDIKLVSRGGARLSDILPVFITKGIYTAVNNKSEDVYKPRMLDASTSDLYIKDDGTLSIMNAGGNYYIDEPASPIIGVVPAPQCPPGYARMITVTPASIRMSEAGRFKNPIGNSSNFKRMRIDVDDFTNPSVGGYWIDNQGTRRHIDDLNATEGAFDPSSPNYVNPSQIHAEGMANQLYIGLVSTATSTEGQNGLTDATKMNPVYQPGVHLVGGSEKWSATNAEGYDHHMEMTVANRDYNFDSEEGIPLEIDGNGFMPSSKLEKLTPSGKRRIVSDEDRRNSTGGNFGSVVSHKITEVNNGVANVYNSKNPKDTAAQMIYGKTANVISNDANSQILSIQDMYYENNAVKVQPRHYKLKQDIDISGTRILADTIRNVEFEDRNGASVYMLTSRDPNAFEPITFQKSTWLKSMAIPLSKRGKYSNNSSSYATGWAILMGFIYPRFAYANILQALNVAQNYQKLPTYETSTKRYRGGYDEHERRSHRITNNEEYFFWNVFPVEQESLEAFVTTYCYFDQDNRAFEMFNNSTDVKNHLPMIDYIGTFTEGYEPEGENKKYRQRLNDPSMKYNELW